MLNRAIKNIELLILISSFLPYIMADYGIRIEHIVIYILFIILIIRGEIQFKLGKSYSLLTVLFALIFILVLIGYLVNQVELNIQSIAFAENYIQTVTLLLIFSYSYDKKHFFSMDKMLKISRCFHILLALNSCLILFEIFTPYADEILNWYVRNDIGDRIKTNSMGRYMGIFNQPFESGLAYSLGLITWTYNFVRLKINYLSFELLIAVLLLTGGLASVSKVFFLGGLALSLGLFLIHSKFRLKLLRITSLLVGLAILLPLFFKNWKGSFYLSELWYSITNEFGLNSITSGRLGSEFGIYNTVFNLDIPVIIGNGFTLGNLNYFDSEYLQILFQGGGIALLLYFIIMINNFRLCFKMNKSLRLEKYLFLAIITIGSLTALGGPLYLMNRVRIFFILQLFFLFAFSKAIAHANKNITNVKYSSSS